MNEDFLVEIGAEELPPKALKRLRDAFANHLAAALKSAGLDYSQLHAFAAPRRLAIWVENLQTQQADQRIERKGPALQGAFDDQGQASKATQGFAKSCGVAVSDLKKVETDKGSYLVYEALVAGRKTAELLPQMVEDALKALPIPKMMRWGSSDVTFVRPVHWIVMLLGEAVIPCTILGKNAGRVTYGHRFHAPAALNITRPGDYLTLLANQGYVLADFEARRQSILQQALEAAADLNAQAILDENLVDEVTALNEWPHAIVGRFEESFLQVPAEALISVMQGHQKYFPMRHQNGQLLNAFITFANIQSTDPSKVRAGNERVIRPRLSDAKFFWTQDQKQPLIAFGERLKTIVFQKDLGTVADKTRRVQTLAGKIAKALGVNVSQAEQAAALSKCDLMSNMVGEFPELQGIMGRYYALASGEDMEVAQAIEEHYWPRFAGDAVPKSGVSIALSLADKLDTLAGIYGLGQVPTGDKDPFALRRAALGVGRIMVENQLSLSLSQLLQWALEDQPFTAKPQVEAELYDFMVDRLRAYFADQGFALQEFDAIRVLRPASPWDFAQRLAAVKAFAQLPEAASLAAANKRIANLLKKSAGAQTLVDVTAFNQAEETALWQAFQTAKTAAQQSMEHNNYTQALQTLAGLKPVVDAYFEGVMVMCEDENLRANRLATLSEVRGEFLRIADLSLLS